MLNSINLSDKTYEELLAEAIAQIPLYSREWTNYNVSDPGITMLQNLTAFQLVQQEAINNVPEEARRKLLKLVGYTARENRAATVLVQAPPEGGPILSPGQKAGSGDRGCPGVQAVGSVFPRFDSDGRVRAAGPGDWQRTGTGSDYPDSLPAEQE